jgi:hypothetical protein
VSTWEPNTYRKGGLVGNPSNGRGQPDEPDVTWAIADRYLSAFLSLILSLQFPKSIKKGVSSPSWETILLNNRPQIASNDNLRKLSL